LKAQGTETITYWALRQRPKEKIPYLLLLTNSVSLSNVYLFFKKQGSAVLILIFSNLTMVEE
jgi:hypothetical protein